jgi:tetratricopeptide (TPR) repeat protein
MPLNDLLSKLYSDENRLAFLRKIYSPGNIEVADRILSINPEDSSVLESEIEHAKEHGMEDRFTALARNFVNRYVTRGFTSSLEGKVIEWGNLTIANYAIAKLQEEGEEDSIEHAAGIAKSFGREEEARILLERLLKIQLKERGKYASSPAGTCVKLGHYNEAIELYMQAGYHWVDTAIKIAKEHAPNRLTEVAQKGFKSYNPGFGSQEIYVECAEILGKTDEAKKTLIKESRELRPDSPPRFYESLVKSLVKLDLVEESKDVVTKVAEFEHEASRKERYYELGRQKELAKLFEAIGDKAPIGGIYSVRIDRGLKERWNPSNILNEINEGYKLTGDIIFLEKKLILLEQEGKYDEAEKLAAELGRHELADAYSAMQKMVQEAEAASGQKK